MRWLGLDVGEKTIGVAVSDAFGWTAQGLEVIRRESKEKDFQRLEEWVNAYNIERIIVGFPKNMDGSIGKKAKEIQRFVKTLEKRLVPEVELWDERLSTMAAERTLLEADVSRRKRKKTIDKMAAVLILQNYLDAKGR